MPVKPPEPEQIDVAEVEWLIALAEQGRLEADGQAQAGIGNPDVEIVRGDELWLAPGDLVPLELMARRQAFRRAL